MSCQWCDAIKKNQKTGFRTFDRFIYRRFKSPQEEERIEYFHKQGKNNPARDLNISCVLNTSMTSNLIRLNTRIIEYSSVIRGTGRHTIITEFLKISKRKGLISINLIWIKKTERSCYLPQICHLVKNYDILLVWSVP